MLTRVDGGDLILGDEGGDGFGDGGEGECLWKLLITIESDSLLTTSIIQPSKQTKD